MSFVTTFDSSAEVIAGVDKDPVAPAIGITIHQQRCLIDAIDHPVCGDVFGGPAQPGEGCEQVGFVDHVVDNFTRLNDTWPPGKGWHAHTAFGDVTFTAAENRIGHTKEAGRIVDQKKNSRERKPQVAEFWGILGLIGEIPPNRLFRGQISAIRHL